MASTTLAAVMPTKSTAARKRGETCDDVSVNLARKTDIGVIGLSR